MFAVDGQKLRAGTRDFGREHMARRDQTLLVGERDASPAGGGCKCRTQARRADDSGHDAVGGHHRCFDKRVYSCCRADAGSGKSVAKFGELAFVTDDREPGAMPPGEDSKLGGVRLRRQRYNFKTIRRTSYEIERAFSDRACGAENGETHRRGSLRRAKSRDRHADHWPIRNARRQCHRFMTRREERAQARRRRSRRRSMLPRCSP